MARKEQLACRIADAVQWELHGVADRLQTTTSVAAGRLLSDHRIVWWADTADGRKLTYDATEAVWFYVPPEGEPIMCVGPRQLFLTVAQELAERGRNGDNAVGRLLADTLLATGDKSVIDLKLWAHEAKLAEVWSSDWVRLERLEQYVKVSLIGFPGVEALVPLESDIDALSLAIAEVTAEALS